ncbi:MAG TPA: hypothetical protein K8V91_00400 [[Clostridium] spiroforme]|uniref:Uncharacterized protein n=1 Tax=Thomasclavelia spiroformis TaxID=29348 RepID=A0A921KID8_9FIRM|nr:hypothetical protein [Thomasclavelia spiroformis]
MKIINIIDKKKADYLKSLGFKCIQSNIDNRIIFQFIEEPKLIQELNSNFEESSYFYTQNMNF